MRKRKNRRKRRRKRRRRNETPTSGQTQDLLQLLTEGVDDDDEAAEKVEGDETLDDRQRRALGHGLQHVVLQLVAVHKVAARRHREVQQHHHCAHSGGKGGGGRCSE